MSRRFVAACLCAAAVLATVTACGGPPAPQPATATTATTATEPPVVNVYNWTDYVDPEVLKQFTKETGIAVNYDTFDSNEILETKMLAGRSGYDVVVVTSTFLETQLKAGVYRELDATQLPNLRNLDAALATKLTTPEGGLRRSVPYHYGITAIGYDAGKLLARLPDAPLDSFALVFDPAVVARFADCGFAIVDSPADVLGAALGWLGRDPNSERPEDLAEVERVLLAIRPYVRYIGTPQINADLVNGEICLALGWSGDVLRARRRAREAGRAADIRFVIPREGAVVFADTLAIPKDAPHPRNAHRLIDFLMRAEVAARLSEFLQYPNANAASWPLIAPAVRDDPMVFPPADAQARLVPDRVESPAFRRQLMRTWTRFKTGR